MLKKVIIIFLCLQILSGNAFGMELMKVHSAITHYFDHESHEHPGESFLDFLHEHYVLGEHAHENGGHCDEDMPFKHCSECGSNHLVVVPFTLPEDLAKISFSYCTVQLPIEAREQFVSSCTLTIWQPPKIS